MRTAPRPSSTPGRNVRFRSRLGIGPGIRAALLFGAATAAALAAPLPAVARLLDAPSLGIRQIPLAYAPEYGAVASIPGSVPTLYLAATSEGFELRNAAAPAGAATGVYRTSGRVTGAAGRGDRVYLFQGARGVSRIDIAAPAAPALLASLETERAANAGAVLADGSCAAYSDSFLQVIRVGAGGTLEQSETVAYTDGRRIARVLARGDSLLVVAARPGALPRLYLTIYRLPASAGPLALLREWIFNGRGANDAAWDGPIAFVADGNNGIHSVNVATGAFGETMPITAGRLVRAIDVDATSLYAVGEAATLQRFDRYGPFGDSLLATAPEALALEPVAVAVVGGRAVAATRDDIAPNEPDEVGRSQLEFPTSAPVPVAPLAPVGTIGRARRVVVRDGLAYVADYTGGLRIYRAGGADTSLVGTLPPLASGRAVDLALDASSGRLYLASGATGLEIVDVADPSSPSRLAALALPGNSSAVAIVDAATVAVARRGVGTSAGVTLVDVSTPTAPFPRGAVNGPFILDPRALAVRDTVLFVADFQLGVLSVGITNRDAPATYGLPSGAAARDVDLQGNLLLVASRSRGLQVVDVFDPAAPLLRSEPFLPPMLGVARQGNSAIGCLGDEGVAVVDVSQPAAAALRSTVAAAGAPRDAAWTGDTLLVAGGTSIERFLLAPAIPASSALAITVDAGSAIPRARIAWSVASAPGQAGWNLYRGRGAVTAGSADPGGERINLSLLAPGAREAADESLVPGMEHRYRLEAVFEDGSLRTVAEGSVYVPSNARVGRPYPNPFRATDGGTLVPYRVLPGVVGTVTLRVYDVRGRLVREISAPVPPGGGFGAIGWDGRGRDGRPAASGMYFLHLKGPGIDDARSALHLR